MVCATFTSPYGFREQSTYKVPLLNAHHPGCTSCLGKEHRDRSAKDWKRVACSDESRYRLFNADEVEEYGVKLMWGSHGSCMLG
ncbi:hypothetical protein TNCV_4964911 [Trichonephila clavipes]|nr:hypothetical protein TNCV_4964911 [Trichonephila clavipes]